ncbi:MAG: xanthine dehydrogenase family protein molybdopterin-binding subunit [Acidimicrobiia bacterium]|nr:xanthine dehydrogenase family protein molybdopterin-binding subunit [Acidimicrobiia bacterium]
MTPSVGRSVPRPDADPKVRGTAVYGVDFEIAGTMFASLVRSPVAAGRVVGLDTTAAAAMPGVRAVITPDQAPAHRSGLGLSDQPLFASPYISYEGEPLAGVVANTLENARQAARAVLVDIEEVPAIADVGAALADGARFIHTDWASFTPVPGLPDWRRYGNVCGELISDPGGVDEAFELADLVIEDRFEAGRQYQAYLEPKSASAVYESGRYTIHVSHQYPFNVRDRTARALGVRPSDIRVVGHHIGGGFGARLDVSLEPYAGLFARLIGAPVKLVNDRVEDMLSCNSRESAVIKVRSGVTRDGRIVAREYLCDMDSGAYATDTVFLISIPMFVAGSVYQVGPTRVVARAVYTNTAPSGAFRGVSGTYLYFALERHTDNLARAIGMDRRDFRMRNLMTDGQSMLNGQVLSDAGILEMAFDAVEEMAPWASLGVGPNRGVGIAATVWLTNPAPGQVTLKLNEDGTLGVITAATENGSGAVAMGVRQIAADELGVDPSDVILTMPDTDGQGFDAGSQGSRTTHIVGRAVREAGADLRRQIVEAGAQLLEESTEDIEITDGMVRVKGRPHRRLSLADLAKGAMFRRGPLAATGSYATPIPKYDPESATGMLFPTFPTPTYHVHVAEVEVDPHTGQVTVLRYLVAQEVGRAINPQGILGQIQGGVAQGIGHALYETLEVGADGRYRQRSLEAYRMPIAPDVPRVEAALLEHPDEAGPYGAKGTAEPPIVPVAAAIANAIADATGGSINRVPITPEDVLEALDGAQDQIRGEEE